MGLFRVPASSRWRVPGAAIREVNKKFSEGKRLRVLAGDTLRAAADMGLPLAAVTLAHRKGYFKQHLDANGVQTEEDQSWDIEDKLNPEEPIVTVTIEGRPVAIRAWRYDMKA